MASNTAWQLGADIARGTVGQKKQKDDDSAPSDAWSVGAPIGQGATQRRKAKSTLKQAQKLTTGLDTSSPVVSALIPSAKRGGWITKDGLVHVHAGEHIVPAKRRIKVFAAQGRAPKAARRRITKLVGSPVGKR
jgi:hypothetical protein